MFSKLITTILLLQQYVVIQTIDVTQPLTNEQAVTVLQVAGWDESLHSEALDIMQCESENNPLALGDYNYGKPYALGLYQVHFSYEDDYMCKDVLGGHFIGYGAYFQCRDDISLNPFNPVDNAYLAKLVYERNGNWSMWSCRKVLD